MAERNLDLDVPLTREQWEVAGRQASTMGRDVAGFEWSGDGARILVFMTNEEARGFWSDHTSEEDEYGETTLKVAEVEFNDGRPYARVLAPDAVQPPAFRPQEVEAMRVGLERFVRGKWQRLLAEAGISAERGHRSEEVE